MNLRKLLGRFKSVLTLFLVALAPYGLVKFYRLVRNKNRVFYIRHYFRCKRLLETNRELKDRHQGERCFIIGNGPSTKTQDLSILKNEVCFTLNRGFAHDFYPLLKPRYHVLAPIEYGVVTPEIAVDRMKTMDQALTPETEVFCALQDERLITQSKSMPHRHVHYLYFGGDWNEIEKNPSAIPDLSNKVPTPQSIPIFSLLIALFMGFKEIILLGTEHNSFITKVRPYAFKNPWKGSFSGFDSNFNLTESMRIVLGQNARSFEQFYYLNRIAQANGVKILNATPETALDEFPRVDLTEYFQTSSQKENFLC